MVAYLPNIPETLVAFLATASLGAIWATCPPEFGVRSVLHRLGQLEPKVLLAVAGYRYGDKEIDRRPQVDEIRAGLPSLEVLVHVLYPGGADDALPDAVSWNELLAEPAEPAFDPLPFAHPLYVLFSSGTTGLPKAIVHCHGGILLEHLKNHGFSWDLQRGDRLQWFTTTAWMMWNALVSVLLHRASIVMIDGNPAFPALSFQWRVLEETRPTFFGLSPAFTMACRKEGLEPGRLFDLSSVRMVCEAGSPLPLEGYEWLYEQFGPDVNVNVGSGRTEICTGARAGDSAASRVGGRDVGAHARRRRRRVRAGRKPVAAKLGELVIKQPMPSMPVGFWNDLDGTRYRDAYFGFFPGVWRFGDWILITERGSAIITGRSDATLNRGGVRLGSSEIYSVVEEIDEVLDSLVVHLEEQDELLLFVVLRPGVELDDALRARIAGALRDSLSPRHAPDTIVAVPAIPRTLTGKKLEVPVSASSPGAGVGRRSERHARRAWLDRAFAAYAQTRSAQPDPLTCGSRARRSLKPAAFAAGRPPFPVPGLLGMQCRSERSTTPSCSPTTWRGQRRSTARRSASRSASARRSRFRATGSLSTASRACTSPSAQRTRRTRRRSVSAAEAARSTTSRLPPKATTRWSHGSRRPESRPSRTTCRQRTCASSSSTTRTASGSS